MREGRKRGVTFEAAGAWWAVAVRGLWQMGSCLALWFVVDV